jgi:mevalonate kinase
VDFKKTFVTRWGESNIAVKALGKLKQYKWKQYLKESINEILTTIDTLIQEAKIADEDQKKSFLREALLKYQNFLAYA